MRPKPQKHYRRAIELSPKTSGLYSDMGLILLSQGRNSEAAKLFLNALDHNPANTSALINYGVVLQKLGQLDQAIAQDARAAQQVPAATQPRSNLGMIYHMKNDAARAREEWEAATRMGSTYPLDRTGLLLLGGKLNEAFTQLEQHTQSNAIDADGWLMFGDVSRALGREAGAQAAYARATQIAPDYARLARPTLLKQISPPAVNAGRSDSQNEEGPRLLMEAAAHGRTTDMQALLERGADVNARSKDGGTALMFASAKGHTETVKALLKSNANANAKDQFGQTALIYAVRYGHAKTVKALLAGGADVHVKSDRGVTPLLLAQEIGDREIAKELKKAGAKE